MCVCECMIACLFIDVEKDLGHDALESKKKKKEPEQSVRGTCIVKSLLND